MASNTLHLQFALSCFASFISELSWELQVLLSTIMLDRYFSCLYSQLVHLGQLWQLCSNASNMCITAVAFVDADLN